MVCTFCGCDNGKHERLRDELAALKADLAEAVGLLRGAEKFCGEETHMNQESAELCPDWLERRDALLRRV